MFDARRNVRGTVSVAVSFAILAALAACGGGAGGGESADGASGGEATQASRAKRYVLPGEEVFPEGIAYQEESGDFYVGSTTDGTVFRGTVEEGPREAEVFLEPGGDGRATAIGMKVDEGGQLFIAGGDTGRIFVYDTQSGDLVDRLDTPETSSTFINDVAVTPDGNAYFTDSLRPTLFRVTAANGGVGEAESWLDFEGTPLRYEEDFNLNGIAATPDGRYLIVVQSNTGELFRIDTGSKEVIQIDLGGDTLTNGDGILLDGGTLYVSRNQQELIVPVELADDYSSGEVGEGFTDPSFAYPTTIATYDGRLLAVNSQFDRQGGDPELPFTVSDVEIP